jgi:hypothetical protein
MCSEIPIESSINWITTTKDIALVILSATAILAGFIQSRNNRRAEWVNDFRQEMAKLLAIAARANVSENEFSQKIVEHFSLISLYINHENKSHIELLEEINVLVITWNEYKTGKKRKDEVNDVVSKITLMVTALIDAENKKL